MLSGPDKELVKFLISIINQKIYSKTKVYHSKFSEKLANLLQLTFRFSKFYYNFWNIKNCPNAETELSS